MTTVRLARAEPRPGPNMASHIVAVLADDTRALPVWLNVMDGHALLEVIRTRVPGGYEPAAALTGRLLDAAGATVAAVDIDEVGPGVSAARIHLSNGHTVTTRMASALALALERDAPIRIADRLMDTLAEPIVDQSTIDRIVDRVPPATLGRQIPSPRQPTPRNMTFDDGLDGWDLRGSFLRDETAGHWEDYTCGVTTSAAYLASAVPEPYGFADLRQAVLADHYRGRVVRFHGECRADGRAALYVRVVTPTSGARENAPESAVSFDWQRHEVTADVPLDATFVLFGITLTGAGRIEIRNPELAPS